MSAGFVPYRPDPIAPAEMVQRAERFHAHLDGRRTVRFFSPDPVPQAAIEHCIRAASTAPSGAHRQPWHFVAVQDPDLKHRIRMAAEEEEARNYQGRMPPEWLKALEPFGTDANKEYLDICPWLIAVFAQNRGPEGKNYYVTESVGIATGMLIAALHDCGLATLTHTPSPMKFLKDVLDRPSGERAYLLIGVGYPSQDCVVPDIKRKPLDQVATFR